MFLRLATTPLPGLLFSSFIVSSLNVVYQLKSLPSSSHSLSPRTVVIISFPLITFPIESDFLFITVSSFFSFFSKPHYSFCQTILFTIFLHIHVSKAFFQTSRFTSVRHYSRRINNILLISSSSTDLCYCKIIQLKCLI